MTKHILRRLLVAGAVAFGVHDARAQTQTCEVSCLLPMPRPGPASPGSPSESSTVPVYAITGVIGAIGVWGFWNQSQIVGCCGNQPSASPEPQPPSPDGVPPTQIQPPRITQGGGPGATGPSGLNAPNAPTRITQGGGPGGGGPGATGPGGPNAPNAPTVQALRGTCNLPPA